MQTNKSVGLYCGSFNPYTLGHHNIYQKAKRIFDTVIVAKGVNSEKVNSKREPSPIEEKLKARYGTTFVVPNDVEHTEYTGLTTDLVKVYRRIYGANVVLVRGLRNSFDFAKEAEQTSILRRLLPDVDVVYISCDTEFSDISSTTARELSAFDEEQAMKLLPITLCV